MHSEHISTQARSAALAFAVAEAGAASSFRYRKSRR
jgi:hypothetical protein